MWLLHTPATQRLWLVFQACLIAASFICAFQVTWLLVPWFKLYSPIQRVHNTLQDAFLAPCLCLR